MIDPGLSALADHTCPDCHGFLFRPGPRGGLARNIECVGCGARFSVAWWAGVLAFAQRIPKTGAWREDLFPQVLQ